MNLTKVNSDLIQLTKENEFLGDMHDYLLDQWSIARNLCQSEEVINFEDEIWSFLRAISDHINEIHIQAKKELKKR